jgi:hypothetical protein
MQYISLALKLLCSEGKHIISAFENFKGGAGYFEFFVGGHYEHRYAACACADCAGFFAALGV